MTERKCGTCGIPGHTRRTCPTRRMPRAETPVSLEQAQRMERDLRREGGAAAELLRAEIGDLGTVIDHITNGPTEFAAPVHVHRFEYGDDGRGHSGAACECGMEEESSEEFTAGAPVYTGQKPGPWFYAQFPGICERGGEGFEQDDEIRADGQGGYECSDCVSDAEGDEPSTPAPPAWVRPTAANVKLPPVPESVPLAIDVKPDLFSAPTPVVVPYAPLDDDPLTNHSGYLIKDPRTGEFRRFKNKNIKGFTRMTTFIKAASDSKAIEAWQKRNVVMGAALRPDLVKQAVGMTHAENKAQLDTIGDLLSEAAGGKRGSSNGTHVHKLTEQVDLGQITIHQVPEEFRQLVMDYRRELDRAQLVIVPELVERTVFLSQFGGIGGQFDRIYRHVPTGTYVMGDVKTGKGLELGWDEIEAQLWGYTTAYNEHGTWNHTEKVWEPPQYRVREDVAVIAHMPVEGPKPGLPPLPVSLQTVDLARGGRYAALCGLVRETRKEKGTPVPWVSPAPVQAPSWHDRFESVKSVAEAGTLWEEARAAGVEPLELQKLVSLAQSALRSMS